MPLPECPISLVALLLVLALVGCGPASAPSDGSQLQRGTALPPPDLAATVRR